MNRSELEARYPLIRPLAGEASHTYLARSGTGAIVMVHFLDASPASWKGGILTRLGEIDLDRRERILEVTEVDGNAAVVTRFLMDFRSFSAWLGEATPGEAPAAPAADEFERLFGRAAAPPLDALSDDGAGSPADVPPPPPPRPERPAAEFGHGQEPHPPGAGEGAAQPAAAREEAAPAGEFTRLFRAQPPPTEPEARPSSPESAAPEVPPAPRSGGQPAASEVPPAPPPGGQPAAPPIAPDPGAGEFTRMFQKLGGSPNTPPPAAPPAPRPSGAGFEDPPPPLWSSSNPDADDRYRERLLGGSPPPPPPPQIPTEEPLPPRPPRVPVDPELPPLPAHMAPPVPPPPPAAGEYTRMIAAQTPPPELPGAPGITPVPPLPPSAAGAPMDAGGGKRSSAFGIMIGFVLVVILALALVLYLVLRTTVAPTPTPETTGDAVPAAEAPPTPPEG